MRLFNASVPCWERSILCLPPSHTSAFLHCLGCTLQVALLPCLWSPPQDIHPPASESSFSSGVRSRPPWTSHPRFIRCTHAIRSTLHIPAIASEITLLQPHVAFLFMIISLFFTSWPLHLLFLLLGERSRFSYDSFFPVSHPMAVTATRDYMFTCLLSVFSVKILPFWGELIRVPPAMSDMS